MLHRWWSSGAYRLHAPPAGAEIAVLNLCRAPLSSPSVVGLDDGVRRLRQTVTDAAAAPSAGCAADHLAAAWRATCGLHPDPVGAYSEAIKAVECGRGERDR